MTTLFLIRHGETDWNMQGRWQGHTDVPLNEIGKRQAVLLAERLRKEKQKFHAIYSSDLVRAYQTAWEIGAAVKVAVQLLPSLREIDLGYWSGLTHAEIRAQYPTEMALLERGQDIPRGGAETLAAVRHRVVEAVDAISAHHKGETLALVTHGGCIRMMLAHAEQFVGDGFKRYPHIGNTSICVIKITRGRWRAERINDMRHLEATHEPEMLSAPPDDAEPPQSL